MKERFGATEEKAQMIRFHTQTGGVTLQAQQPEVDIIPVALQGFAAVAGGTQSLHTNGFDEALALPTERSARIALRTQQVLAHESGVADTVDPFAGSYFIESLTDEIEERSWELMEKVEQLGGSVNALFEFMQREIEESAASYHERYRTGQDVIVGVNKYETDVVDDVEILKVDPEAERRQLERLAKFKAGRNQGDVDARLADLRKVAEGEGDLLPPIKEGRCAPAARSARSAMRCATSSANTAAVPSSSWHLHGVPRSIGEGLIDSNSARPGHVHAWLRNNILGLVAIFIRSLRLGDRGQRGESAGRAEGRQEEEGQAGAARTRGSAGTARRSGPPRPGDRPRRRRPERKLPEPRPGATASWQNITFATGSANGGGGIYAPVGCYRDAMEVVHLRGRATRSTGTTTVGTLPVACRPSIWWPNVLVVEVDAGGDGAGALAVFISPNNGGVTVLNGALPAGLNFDGVSFRATN